MSGTFDMGRNILVINVDIRETRVALIENGIIAELHLERESSKGTLGNIYVGKVSRVLPGMQAAFIDVGLERAAFLHVEDLIRPDDFEAYLQGHRRGSEEERETRSSDDDERLLEPHVHRPPVADRPVIVADALLPEPDDDEPVVFAARDSEPGLDPGARLADDPIADEVADEVEADADSVYSAASEVLAHEAALAEARAAAFDSERDAAEADDADDAGDLDEPYADEADPRAAFAREAEADEADDLDADDADDADEADDADDEPLLAARADDAPDSDEPADEPVDEPTSDDALHAGPPVIVDEPTEDLDSDVPPGAEPAADLDLPGVVASPPPTSSSPRPVRAIRRRRSPARRRGPRRRTRRRRARHHRRPAAAPPSRGPPRPRPPLAQHPRSHPRGDGHRRRRGRGSPTPASRAPRPW
ncbi:MAG: hypothetical protein R3F14_45735 [Polyangiaceae bacterium]